MNKILRNTIIVIVGLVTFIIILGVFSFSPIPDVGDLEETSSISGARDLNGQWAGTVSFTERVPNCAYRGALVLNLGQNGNNLNGGFTLSIDEIVTQGPNCLRVGTVLPPSAVSGTASSSSINLLISNTDKLKGSFTTDAMTLRWEICDNCQAGPAIKFVGPMQLRRQ